MWRRSRLAPSLVVACSLASACAAKPQEDTRQAGIPNRNVDQAAVAGKPASAMLPTSTLGAAGSAPSLAPISGAPSVGPTTPSNTCDVVQLVAAPHVPDMMIVLDRSGSMQRGGRWQPSVAAVRKITAQLEARIRFGLMVFPGDNSMTVTQSSANGSFTISISGGDICTPGKVVVPIAELNASQIAMKLDMTLPNGGTPTSESLKQLDSSFAMMPDAPDAPQHAKYVLLVTDGAPTCPNGMGNGDQPNQPDVDLTNQAIESLTAHMVKTYVVGYDTATPGNEALAMALDGFAQRGGTGDQKHRPVEDEASLTAVLESITSSIASCSFKLNKTPPRPDFVLITLDGKQLNLDDPNGWHLVDDVTVEIVGNACTTFKNGSHLLDATVQCQVVTPT